MSRGFSFKCSACGGAVYRISQLRCSSGGFMAYMDWDDKVMTCVTCQACLKVDLYDQPYTEFMSERGLPDDLLE